MQEALCTLILLAVALAVPHAQTDHGTPAGVAAPAASARQECKRGENQPFVDAAYACVGWIHDPSEPRSAPQKQPALVAVEGQLASLSGRVSSLTFTGVNGVVNDLFSAIVAVAVERAKRDGLALVKERLERDVCEARAPGGTDAPPLLPNTCALIRTTDLLTLVGQATALRAALVADAVRLARQELKKAHTDMLPPFVGAADTGLRVVERAVSQPRFVLTRNDVWLVVDAFLNTTWKKDAADTPATVAAERAVIETAVAVARVYVMAEQMRLSANPDAAPADLAEVIRLEIANCRIVFANCKDIANNIDLIGRLRDFSLLAVKAVEAVQATPQGATDDLRAQLRNAMDFVFSASGSIGHPQTHQWMRAVALSALDGDAPHLISAIALVGRDLAKGCEKDQDCLQRQKVVALLTSVSTFALSYQPIPADATAEQRVVLEKGQQEQRKQAIGSIVDAAADRRNRAGDRVWGLGIGVGAMLYANQHFPGFDGVLDCAKNGSTSPTCNQAVDFHAPLGISWQKLPGKGVPFHVGLSFVDLGNYMTTDQSTQQQVDWKAIFAPGLQVGIPLGKPNRFFVAGFTASYIPHFSVDETSSQVQDAWKFGFFVHYYLSLWDFD